MALVIIKFKEIDRTSIDFKYIHKHTFKNNGTRQLADIVVYLNSTVEPVVPDKLGERALS